MPHPSHIIDLVVLPMDMAKVIPIAAFDALCLVWQERGWLRGLQPGAAVDELLPGGFARIRRDAPTRMVLYANQQGGFRVRCPQTNANIAAHFGAALLAWKRGAPRQLQCPSCSAEHPLESCTLQPPGAFAQTAIIFADAASITLSPTATADLAQLIGPTTQIIRRV